MSATLDRPSKGRAVAVGAGVLVGALLAAFFVTFNGLFTDGPSELLSGERIVTYLITLVAHGLLAWLGARFGGGRWTTWALLAAVPSLLVCVLYAMREPGVVLLAILYGGFAAIAAGAGAKVGGRLPLRGD